MMKKTCLSMQETQEMQGQSLGWEDLLGEEMALPTPIFLPRESHGQRSLAGYSPRRVIIHSLDRLLLLLLSRFSRV